jgi:hypothetical protein
MPAGRDITNVQRTKLLLGKLLSLPFVLSLTACPNVEAYWSTPISIKEGLAVVERDLAQANPVVLSEVPPVSKSPQPGPDWTDSIRKAIFAAQCLNRVNNPPVPVLTGAISVALTGQFTTTPSAQIGWTAGPSGQLGFQVSISQTQGLTIPIQFISARALPNFYLQQNLAMLQYADDKTKATLIPDIVSTRQRLEDVVTSAIQDYPEDSGICPATLDQALVASPIVPATTPPVGHGGPGRQSNPQGPR